MVTAVESASKDADDETIEQPMISKNVTKAMALINQESEKESEKRRREGRVETKNALLQKRIWRF